MKRINVSEMMNEFAGSGVKKRSSEVDKGRENGSLLAERGAEGTAGCQEEGWRMSKWISNAVRNQWPKDRTNA